RFFLKLLSASIITYILIGITTMLIVGFPYGWEQHLSYARLLLRIVAGSYPWRIPTDPFLGYNHSIKQILVYLVDLTPRVLQIATAIKMIVLTPLALVVLRYLYHPPHLTKNESLQQGIAMALALYTGAFIWLDVVWELSLGIAVFAYLLATLEQRRAKLLVWVIFLPYALIDFFQVGGYVLFGQDVILPGLYILTDPSIYLPLTMFVILTFYGLLLKRLWNTTPALTKKAI
ncbi:MAG: hypothetical protein K8R89_09780, partial [Anaerolineae bacterium]|nr:hypothetical protein [Anaerolineae bacterium]